MTIAFPLRIALTLALLCSLATTTSGYAQDDAVEAAKPAEATPDIPAVDPAQIAAWVEQLDSDVYTERESATKQLIAADLQAIDVLSQAASGASPEASVRIAHILEQIYINSTSDASIDSSEAALESFKTLKNPTLASRAELILEANYGVREKRAIAEIQRLGGTIDFAEPQNINFNRAGVDSQIEHIVIGKQWKGGDEGLKHIKRLTQLRVLYFIRGADVSEDALADLQKALPATQFQMRMPAYLGIAGFPHNQGCQVMTVKEGSAADDAGLMIGDVITKFGDKQVKDFEALIKEIAECEPGDKIELTIIRFGDFIKLPVVLGEWGAPRRNDG